jgi:hypothetical protein
MAIPYNNNLLAPFLALPQGEKIQAECTSPSFFVLYFLSNPPNQMFGLMATAGFVQKLLSVSF